MATSQSATTAATGTLATDDGTPSPARFLLLLGGVALVLVAAWLRCHLLGNIPGLNGDEAWYGVQAWNMSHGGTIQWHTPTGNPLNPLFVGPLALLHLCVPPSFVVLRSVALLSGLVALAINWFFCCRVFDRRTATVSTVALAILPINIAYSRFAWDASQSLAATLPVLYCSLAAVKHVDRFGRWFAIAMLALAVAIWVHPTNLFAGAAIAGACLAYWRRKQLATDARPSGVVDVPACPRDPDRTAGKDCLPLRRDTLALFVLALAALIIAAWILAARPTHGLLAQHVAARLDDVRQLDRGDGVPSVFVLYARLFTGGTIYRYLAGSRSWFEWPQSKSADGWGVDVAVFWACVLGSAWLVWRNRRPSAADSVLLTAWALELVAFTAVAGPRAMVPGQERFSICLLAPTVLLISRGAVVLWEIASKRWRVVLSIATLIAWPLLADFHVHYFRFIERTGGQAHLTFRTAAIEPKQAAFQYILADADGTSPVWIVASQWWNRWPIRYLALAEPRVNVLEPSELDGSEAYRRAAAAGRVWYVEFFDTPAQQAVDSQLSGRSAECQTFPDYAGRPLLTVSHAGNR